MKRAAALLREEARVIYENNITGGSSGPDPEEPTWAEGTEEAQHRCMEMIGLAEELDRTGEMLPAGVAFLLIELGEFHVFPPDRRRGEAERKWTVRKEDPLGNTVSQHRAALLREAVMAVVGEVGVKLSTEG
jgi:hypothetical protein